MKRSAILMFLALLFGVFSLSFIVRAADLSDLSSAESLYRNGDYQGAIRIYEDILDQGWTNGAIYYNLGNCYYKLGQYGRAILNYERARHYLGNDPDLQVNLKLANLRIADRIEPLPRLFVFKVINGIGKLFPIRRWASLMILGEWAFLIFMLSLLIVRRPRWRRWLAGGLLTAVALFVVSGAFLLQQKVQQAGTTQGIVLAEKVDVRSAPEAGSTELFSIHEGVKINVMRTISGWAEIRLADGKQGWMPTSAFEEI